MSSTSSHPKVETQWEHVHPGRHRYEFVRTDALFDVAEAAGLKLHGHSLVWHFQNPPWLSANALSRDDLIAVLRDHIQTVVGRYKGRVHVWDVVNEPIETRAWEDGFGSLHGSIWSRVIGEENIELAFRFAHEADSSATSQEIIETLLLRGVPIHGLGFQLHIELENEPRFGARGAFRRTHAALRGAGPRDLHQRDGRSHTRAGNGSKARGPS